MATQSFHEIMEIDTPEKAKRLVKAFRDAEERGPYESPVDIRAKLEEDEKLIGSMNFK